MQQSRIKIHVLGMDDRNQSTLDLFFQKFCNNRCEISDEQNAQAFLINMDAVDAGKILARLSKTYPKLPLILTSIRPVNENGHYFLRKPMIAGHLVTIIDQISGVLAKPTLQKLNTSINEAKSIEPALTGLPPQALKTESKNKLALNDKELCALVGEAKDVDLRKLINPERIFFDLEQYFLGFLYKAYQQAQKEQCAVKITGLWKPIIIFAKSNQLYVEMSAPQLKSICAVSLESSSIIRTEIKIESLEADKASWLCNDRKNYQRLDLFMWKIALWTSRGRLPKEIPLDSPLYLSAWPNLSRLIIIPDALRLCAYWAVHPRTVINLTEVLDSPQRHVFALITASYILGLSGVANRQSDILILPSNVELTSKWNLFSRIMKKLT